MQRPEDDMTLEQMFQGASDPAMLDEFGSLRQAQQSSMAQHEAYSQQLGQQEAVTQERSADLAMTSRIYQLLDPNTPKAARGFLYNETAKALGLDPKATSTSEIGKVLTSLDPQSAAAVRTMIGQGVREATPGDARKMYKAIFNGDVPMSEIVSRAQAAAQTASTERQGEVSRMGDGMMRLGGPTEEESPETGNAPAAVTTPDVARLPPLQRPAPPGLAARVGLDPARPWTMQDVVERGYTGPTSDEAAIQKFLQGTGRNDPGLEGRDQAFRDLSGNFVQMESIIRTGGRDILRWGVVRMPMGMGDYPIPTQSEINVGTRATVEKAFPEIAERWARQDAEAAGNRPQNDPNATGEDRPNARTNFWARQAAKMLGKELPATREGDPDAPATAPVNQDRENVALTAKLEGLLSDSVFLLGRISGQAGRELSDKDRDIFMQQFGATTDPEARIRVIRDTFARQYDRILQDRQGLQLDFGKLTPEQRGMMLNSGIIPEGLRNQLQAYNNREASRQAPPNQQAAPAANQQTPPAAEAETPPAAAERRPAPAERAAPTERQAAPTEPERATPPEGMNRAERQQWQARQRAQEDRQFRLAQMQIVLNSEMRNQDAANRADETHRSGSPFQRQEIARRQMERAQDKFQAAMSKIASMLAGSSPRMSGGGGGGGGGGQDSRAFQLPQKPQRAAPRIPQISKRRRSDD